MGTFISSSTLKPSFLESHLTLNGVSFLTFLEYKPFSNIDLPLSLVPAVKILNKENKAACQL
jgi:hypothetical protein